MKAFSRCVLLFLVVVPASAAAAGTASAATWNPDNTAVSGMATEPALAYEGTTMLCDTGTLDGNTGQDSDTIAGLAVDFFQSCTLAGIVDVTVNCGESSTVDLIILSGGGLTLKLNDDFLCVFTAEGLCSVTLAGPQTPHASSVTFAEVSDTLHVDADFDATRDPEGSELCGPEQGIFNWTADYEMTPSSLSIDP